MFYLGYIINVIFKIKNMSEKKLKEDSFERIEQRETEPKSLEKEIKPEKLPEKVAGLVNEVKQNGDELRKKIEERKPESEIMEEFDKKEKTIEDEAKKAANLIIKNNNMENKGENNTEERKEEILNRLAKIREEQGRILNSKIKPEEIRSKLELLEQEKKELNKEFNIYEKVGTEKEKTGELEISPVNLKEERLSSEEFQELQGIIKKVDAEIEFLKISTDSREEKIESVEKQLSALKEILPKFHTANYEESQLFRKANGLNEKLLQFKKEPYLLD